MITYDENGKIIENPNLEAGTLVGIQVNVMHEWIVDELAEFEEKVIAEYPNGGKDVAVVEVKPEVGHWITTDQHGNVIPFEKGCPDDWRETAPIPDIIEAQVYHEYTPEEIEEAARDKILSDISDLQAYLAETDYISAKAMDSLLGCTETSEMLSVMSAFKSEYSETISERQECRDRINELRAEL